MTTRLPHAAKPVQPAGKRPTTQTAIPCGAGVVDTAALDASLGYSLRRAQMSTFHEFSATMAKHHVRPSHYAVLVLIRANPGLSQSAVCAHLGIQKANFVTLLDSLEDRGLTERRKVIGDRRASALHLTRSGEVFVKRIETSHEAHEEALHARMSQRKTRQLLKLLHEFAGAAQ